MSAASLTGCLHEVSLLPLINGERFRAPLSPPSLPAFEIFVAGRGGVRNAALRSLMLTRSHGRDTEEEPAAGAQRVPTAAQTRTDPHYLQHDHNYC